MKYRSLMIAIALFAALTPVIARAAPAWHVFATAHPAPLFYQAAGLAVGGRGNIFVADGGAHRVEKIAPSGKVLAVWGGDTPGPLRFSGPQEITVDPAGHVYLADNGVVKLSSSGRFLARWTGGGLAQPSGLAIGSNGTIYVLSLHPVPYYSLYDRLTVTRLSPIGRIIASRVYTYAQPAGDALLSAALAVTPTGNVVLSIAGRKYCHDCDGTYYQLWTLSPSLGTAAQVAAPIGGAGLAVDQSGGIYLGAAGKVEKVSAAGTLLASWGTAGCGPAQFGNDLRLAAGPQGALYVADSQVAAIRPDHVVARFRDGVLHVIRSDGTSPALFGRCPSDLSTLFGQAAGVAVSSRGVVYVADEVTGRIQAFAPDGTPGSAFPVEHPSAITVDAGGNLYLPNLQEDTLEKRAPDGALLGRLTGAGFEAVAVDRAGSIYGLTTDGMVWVLRPISASGGTTGAVVIRRWWLKGYAPHQGGLNPTGIALDGRGSLYVADTRYGRVQKFSTSGRLLAVWGGRPGSGPGRFQQPDGIAADGRGHVYVLDSGNDRIQEVDARGRLLAVLGRQGQAPGQFIQPAGIAVGGRGNVFVADTGNDRIEKLVVTP